MHCVLILHDIRSVLNVGAIFRTADAIGVKKIYLSGYTPTPLDRFGRIRADLHKAALGAEDSVPWEGIENVAHLIESLKKEDFEIIALEQDSQALDYKTYNPTKKFVLILGNEVGGVSREILNMCDKVIEIPMCGTKESLNVSVAAGIALFRLLDLQTNT